MGIFIDTASINSIIHYLENGGSEELDKWTVETSRETSAILMLSTGVQVVSSPQRKKESYGKYGDLRRALSSSVFEDSVHNKIHVKALSSAQRWISRNRKQLRLVFNSIKDSPQCVEWLENEKRRIWIHHSVTHNGLFNSAFISGTAYFLEVGKDRIKELHVLSKNVKEIKRYVVKGVNSADFGLIEDAYIYSALVRGVYQDYIARGLRSSIIQHPLRRNHRFLPSVTFKSNIRSGIPNTAAYLSEIILNVSAREAAGERLKVFAGYLDKVRRAVQAEEIDLVHKSTVNAAVDSAVSVAMKLQIHTRKRVCYDAVDGLIALGAGAISSFVLEPFTGFALGMGVYGVSRNANLGEKVLHQFDTEKRYQDVISSVPGRVSGLTKN